MALRMVKTDKPFTVLSVEADKDYLLARAMNFAGHAFHNRAGYFSHQACEKYLKAIMLQASGAYSEGHKLLDLGAICAERHVFFKENDVVETLNIFDEFEQVGRYGAAANFDPKAKSDDKIQTAGVMMWSEQYIQRLDHFVYHTRGLLDFKKANYADSFSAMLRGEQGKLFTEWNLRPPLSVILRKDNRYFKREFS
jgi:HEPN domain-containing protein